MLIGGGRLDPPEDVVGAAQPVEHLLAMLTFEDVAGLELINHLVHKPHRRQHPSMVSDLLAR
ncbi:hypothetical protein Abr02nite_79640 [Paractinoplanes brasiliensis]|nr:hypothetical protein Abr02nite_79640 [Actinoplanes brasiliensis]